VSGHHTHHDHGPLEAIDHVHGGAMVLDIGGSIGALHVLVDDGWVGRELFLATDDPSFRVHTGVWLRHVDGEHVASALFAALEAGTYHVLGDDGAAVATALVTGGEVVEIDLMARPDGAARADTAR
jgi:hypothetical protein